MINIPRRTLEGFVRPDKLEKIHESMVSAGVPGADELLASMVNSQMLLLLEAAIARHGRARGRSSLGRERPLDGQVVRRASKSFERLCDEDLAKIRQTYSDEY